MFFFPRKLGGRAPPYPQKTGGCMEEFFLHDLAKDKLSPTCCVDSSMSREIFLSFERSAYVPSLYFDLRSECALQNQPGKQNIQTFSTPLLSLKFFGH